MGGPADPAEVALKSYSTGDTQNGKLGSLGTTGGQCLKGQVLRENIRGLSCSTVLLGCSYPVLSSWGCGTTEVRSLPSRSLRAKGSPGNDFSVESQEKSIGCWRCAGCPGGVGWHRPVPQDAGPSCFPPHVPFHVARSVEGGRKSALQERTRGDAERAKDFGRAGQAVGGEQERERGDRKGPWRRERGL